MLKNISHIAVRQAIEMERRVQDWILGGGLGEGWVCEEYQQHSDAHSLKFVLELPKLHDARHWKAECGVDSDGRQRSGHQLSLVSTEFMRWM